MGLTTFGLLPKVIRFVVHFFPIREVPVANRIFGFDMDDTLFPTARRYHRVMWECGLLIDQALGVRSPHPKDVIDYQQMTDIKMIEAHGYEINRFPESWVLTYQEMARQFSVTEDPVIVQQLRRVALRFQDGPYDVFPGVYDVLQGLRDAGDELHLISAGAGCEELQHRKVDEAGIRKFFHSITITPSDKTPAMRRIFSGREARSFMVGDSKRHDIAPAIELGVTAIWIPSTSWSFAHADLDRSQYHIISGVHELPSLLTRLNT
jgi:putative hydrolase of the HAD superfamily